MKKYYSFIFIVFIICISITTLKIYAGGEDDLKFDSNGALTFTTTDTKATTSVKYRTVGFTISNLARTQSVVLMLEEDTSRDLLDGSIESIFSTDRDTLFERIGETDPAWQRELYQNGGEVWLDGIFTIVSYGEILGGLSDQGRSEWGEVHYTLPRIKTARAWADPDSLDQYYNLKLYFPPHPELLSGNLYVRCFTDDGVPLQQYDRDIPLSADSGTPIQVSNTMINGYQFFGSRFAYDRPPSGPLSTSSSYSITYDGSTFKDAYLYYYYTRPSIEIGENGMNAVYASTSIPATVIKADERHNEIFDVTKGIPGSEELYVNVFGKQYLYNYNFVEESGTRSYPVTVTKTYNLTWQEDNGEYVIGTDGRRVWDSDWDLETESVIVTKSYDVSRDYSYWMIGELSLYALQNAAITNAVLPGGGITLTPSGYTPPSIDTWTSQTLSDHLTDPASGTIQVTLPEAVLNGGRGGRPSVPDEDWYSDASQNVGQIQVRNDHLLLNGIELMSADWTFANTADPGKIPNAPAIDEAVLYSKDLQIPPTKPNASYPSSGVIVYKRIIDINSSGSEFYSQTIPGINPVVVHTPVACDGGIYNDSVFNQEIKPDTSRAALILTRPSTLRLKTTGSHRTIAGFGNRDFEKYTAAKQIQFPFDVYINTASPVAANFLPSGTWWSIPLNQDDVTFYLPGWVQEGNYTVNYRTIALNGSPAGRTERLVNLDATHTVATDSSPVRVIGRLYGFKITDVENYPLWENVFRTGTGSLNPSGKYFSIGTRTSNNLISTQPAGFTLPILNGSHPTVANQGALALGYTFKYELETVGNYSADQDCIRILPTFEFVKSDGSRQPVDLYYNALIDNQSRYFVPVGSTLDDQHVHYIKIGDPDRMVPLQEIRDTSTLLGLTEDVFKNTTSKLGWLDMQILSKPLRTFKGDSAGLPAGIPVGMAKTSIQHWYGEYALPAETFAAPKGYDVNGYSRTHQGMDGSESFWLKDGYIIVNFSIQTIKNGDFSNPVLAYFGTPLANMWSIEGFNYIKKDTAGVQYHLKDGDVVFYDPKRSASDDYNSLGTH